MVEVTGKPFDEASKEAALKLLKYVGGSNDKGAGMGMTAPVSITAFPAEDKSLERNTTFSFSDSTEADSRILVELTETNLHQC